MDEHNRRTVVRSAAGLSGGLAGDTGKRRLVLLPRRHQRRHVGVLLFPRLPSWLRANYRQWSSRLLPRQPRRRLLLHAGGVGGAITDYWCRTAAGSSVATSVAEFRPGAATERS